MSDEENEQPKPDEQLMMSLSDIVNDAATQLHFDKAYETLLRIGVIISLWKKYMMIEGGFSPAWCEEAGMEILRKILSNPGEG
jgi:hypothetical protein